VLDWTGATLLYAAYLASLAWLVPRFARARLPALVGLSLATAVWWWWPGLGAETAVTMALTWVVVPSLVLLGTYRISGAFFVRPSEALEHWLLSIDEALLNETGLLRAYRRAPLVVPEIFEIFYLLVYAVVPAGATVLLMGGHQAALDTYWATVFVAELACYAALPWLQSRPPRALEARGAPGGAARNLNAWLLRHGSIQGNTFPSAHAAGATAIGLAVYSAMPLAGTAFLVIAAGITVATVLGRYHYALDSMLGVAVALTSWLVLGQ
jgi:membrane-associated phospholipid phosphatase